MEQPDPAIPHCPPPPRSAALAELERRVVATILGDPRAVRSIHGALCPWCVFADQRNAALVAHATEDHRRPLGLQRLARELWRRGAAGITHAGAAQYVAALALDEPVDDLNAALLRLCADDVAAT